MRYKKIIFISFLLFGMTGWVWAQNDHYPEFMEMANKAYADKKIDLALTYYQAAADDNEDYWPAYQGLGSCYYLKGKKKEALKAFEKALSLNPDNPQISRFVQALRKLLGLAPLPTPTPTAIPVMPTVVPVTQ